MADLGESGAPFMLKGKRIWVAGHRGMVGAATVLRLRAEDCEILTAGREVVDLRRQAETEDWIAQARPDGPGNRGWKGRRRPLTERVEVSETKMVGRNLFG